MVGAFNSPCSEYRTATAVALCAIARLSGLRSPLMILRLASNGAAAVGVRTEGQWTEAENEISVPALTPSPRSRVHKAHEIVPKTSLFKTQNRPLVSGW